MRNDEHPAEVQFRSGKDDGRTVFHKARWQRLPTSAPSDWYKHVPVKRQDLYRNIQLEATGSESCIAEECIEICHNRAIVLKLKHLTSENVSVSSRPMRETKSYDTNGTAVTTTDLGWEQVSTVRQIERAVINYGCVLQNLWPTDYSAWALLRIMDYYSWMSHVKNPKTRVQLLTKTINKIFRQNATRAANHSHPLEYKELERTIRSTLSDNGFSPEPPTVQEENQDFRTYQKGNGYGNNSSGQRQNQNYQNQSYAQQNFQQFSQQQNSAQQFPKQQSARKPASYNNLSVCYAFNNTDKPPRLCTNRKASSNTCSDGKKEFAHVCNVFLTSQMRHCLGNHPRSKHR